MGRPAEKTKPKTGNSRLKTEIRNPKTRLDQLLVARGLAKSRAQAQALILAGRVAVEGLARPKAGAWLPEAARVTVKESSPFVSRGGEKLAGALNHFQVSPAGKVALDTGASTGGFTHVLLTRGAGKVYAVDVGYGQLDLTLRNDPRVVVLERVNIRRLPTEAIPEPIDLATLDLSFISLTLVLPKILELLRPGGEIVALVKPQFEVGKGQVGKGGVVRDPQLQQAAVARVAAAAAALGLQVSPAFPSPLKGPKGNQEYFLHLIRQGQVPDSIDKPED
ncbi:MAG: TlyA family RNA methyltransferase [Deltaproteobacteria bacterium]|nr:TlyA family RNA methyltransferase [Deltaproteobacteria bacterium]